VAGFGAARTPSPDVRLEERLPGSSPIHSGARPCGRLRGRPCSVAGRSPRPSMASALSAPLALSPSGLRWPARPALGARAPPRWNAARKARDGFILDAASLRRRDAAAHIQGMKAMDGFILHARGIRRRDAAAHIQGMKAMDGFIPV